MVCGEVITSLNKPTDTGRRIWYVRARYDLGGGTTKTAELNICSIKEAPVVPQSVPVPVPTPPTIPDIPLAAEAVAIIAPRRIIVHPYIVAVALPVDDPEIPQPVPEEYSVTITVSIVVLIPPLPLPDNPVIPPIAPENETIYAVQPADPPPSTTINEAGEPVLSLNYGYKWYKYDNPNYLPTNGYVHAKQWIIKRTSGDTISENGHVTRECLPLDYFLCPFPEEQTILTLRMTKIQLKLT